MLKLEIGVFWFDYLHFGGGDVPGLASRFCTFSVSCLLLCRTSTCKIEVGVFWLTIPTCWGGGDVPGLASRLLFSMFSSETPKSSNYNVWVADDGNTTMEAERYSTRLHTSPWWIESGKSDCVMIDRIIISRN